ncbi:D-ribose pyranase [Peptococcaceae bacterium CEB3]|nr:D-ribose pyranase [Peptococcaceae bacterium CEB3]
MKKRGILNERISGAIAGLGHMDQMIICDAGFPVPKNTEKIDLALSSGIPSFKDTLKGVLSEMVVEKIVLAAETEKVSPQFYQWLREVFVNQECEVVPHAQLKELSKEVKFVIRTGEFIPYANILLIAASQPEGFKQGFDVEIK